MEISTRLYYLFKSITLGGKYMFRLWFNALDQGREEKRRKKKTVNIIKIVQEMKHPTNKVYK